jgi:uncharacterized protein YndB with AHSA1/START domain
MTAATDDIVCEQTYPHPIERVWRALTSSEGLAVWLMPNDFEPRLGHRFTFRTAPEHMWNGIVACEVVALEEPHRVAYTWQGGELPQTLVEFTLTPVKQGTHLRLVHSGFGAGGKPALTVRDIMGAGWRSKILFERLPALLERWQQEDESANAGTSTRKGTA